MINGDTLTYAQYQSIGIFLDTTNCNGVVLTADYDITVGFSTLEGKTLTASYFWGEDSHTLIGSVINGVTYGTILTPTAIRNTASENVKIYPNPVKNYLSIADPANTIVRIDIYDVAGNLLLTSTDIENIYTGNLNPGVYILEVSDVNKNIKPVKIIKY